MDIYNLGLQELITRKIHDRGLSGFILKLNFDKFPPILDILNFEEIATELKGRTSLEDFEAYERAVASGFTLILCVCPI